MKSKGISVLTQMGRFAACTDIGTPQLCTQSMRRESSTRARRSGSPKFSMNYKKNKIQLRASEPQSRLSSQLFSPRMLAWTRQGEAPVDWILPLHLPVSFSPQKSCLPISYSALSVRVARSSTRYFCLVPRSRSPEGLNLAHPG